MSLLTTLAVMALVGGFLQINATARDAMSENAVPRLLSSGNGMIESVFNGWGLSALRSASGKIFPYAALVLEFLIFVFFLIVREGV